MGNLHEYLALLLKYGEKNENAIVAGLTFQQSPLIALLNAPHCSEEWLDMLLFQTLDKIPKDKVVIPTNVLQSAIKICEEKKLNEKFGQMIKRYADKTDQKLL